MKIKNKLEIIDLDIKNNNFDHALKKLNTLKKTNPNNPDVLIRLVKVYYLKEEYSKSLIFINLLNQIIKNDRNLKLLNFEIAIKAKDITKCYTLISQLEQEYLDDEILGLKIQLYILDKKYQQAIECLEKKLGKSRDKDIEILLEISYLLNLNKQYEKSIEIINKVIQLDNQLYRAFYNKGVVLANLKKYQESLDAYQKAFNIDSSDQKIYQEMSCQYLHLNNFEMAMKLIDLAIIKFTDNANLKCIKAYLLILKKQKNMAHHIYDELIETNSGFFRTYCDKSYLLLAEGNYQEGWKYYQYRQDLVGKCSTDDRDIQNISEISKTNLEIDIVPEQGIGDHIFHSRLLQKLNIDNKINVFTDKRIIQLLKNNYNHINFYDQEQYKLNKKNFCINLASLARFFINDEKDISFKNYKIENLKSNNFNKYIGISWFSGNSDWGDSKSIPLELFGKINIPEGGSFYNLQYGNVHQDILDYNTKHKEKIINDPNIDKFYQLYELCQIISGCNFIITVSNITAHLAGALGKKCFLLLPKHHGKMWYWQSKNLKSIWYPSVTVIEQNMHETWSDSITKLNLQIKDN